MQNNDKKLRVVHLFSGIGAPERALTRLKIPFEIVGYSEIDKYAIQAYRALNGDVPNLGSVKDVEKLPKCNLVVYGSPCLTGDTLVLTKDGYKPINEVKEGDSVITHTNSWHKVLRIGGRFCDDIYTIKAQGILDITASGNHPFYIRYRNRVWDNSIRRYKFEFSEPQKELLKDIKDNAFIGVPILNLSKNDLNITEEECWVLGRFIADGHYTKAREIILSVGISKCESVERQLKNYEYSKYKNTPSCYRYVLRDSNLRNLVESLNLNKYAHEKEIPYELLILPKHLLEQVLLGYFSGDGCTINNVMQATTVSKPLALSLTMAIQKVYEVGCRIYHDKRKPKHIIEGRVVNQRDTYMIRFNKAETKKSYIKIGDIIWYPVKSVRKQETTTDVYNIEVDEDHTYTANNCITFNCQDFSAAGKQQGLIDSEGNQTRSGLLFEVERLLETAKANDELPEYLCMENVKNLVSKKFKPDFDRWLNKLEELGYDNYWKVINAKDYLVPQNRERVFIISIRKDLVQTYEFPEPKPLTKRLKDILEPKVDEKYYLSETAIKGFLRHNKNHEAKGTGFLWKPKTGEDTANCLRANGALAPTDNTIIEEGNIYPNSGNPQAGRIYNSDGISPCLDTCSGGNRMPKIIEEPIIAASRGRNPENPSDRTAGTPTEQRLEINSQGIANTLTTVQKDNLVIEPTIEQVGQTDSHQKGGVYNPDGIIPTLLASDYKQPKQIIERADVLTNPPFRVRRLTPRECWRLMAFTDKEFDTVQATGISNTQLYKMAGNSIVVNCLVALFFNLLKKPTKRENE